MHQREAKFRKLPLHRRSAERYERMHLRATRARGIVREAIKVSRQPQSLDMRLLGWAHARAERKLKQIPAIPARLITIGTLLAILYVPSDHVKMLLIFVLPFAAFFVAMPLAFVIASAIGPPDVLTRREYDRLRAKYADRLLAEEAR